MKLCLCGHPENQHSGGQCLVSVPVRRADGVMDRGPCDCREYRPVQQEALL